MAANLLSASQCENATSNGASVRKLPAGDGLYVWVYSNDASIGGCATGRPAGKKSLPLGAYPKVSLSDAGKKRDELGKQLQADLDLFLASLPFN